LSFWWSNLLAEKGRRCRGWRETLACAGLAFGIFFAREDNQSQSAELTGITTLMQQGKLPKPNCGFCSTSSASAKCPGGEELLPKDCWLLQSAATSTDKPMQPLFGFRQLSLLHQCSNSGQFSALGSGYPRRAKKCQSQPWRTPKFPSTPRPRGLFPPTKLLHKSSR